MHVKVEAELAEKLKSHVYRLSHEIGDRSVFEYESLQKAARYIAGEFDSFGYKVGFQEYDVSAKKVKNIISGQENPL